MASGRLPQPNIALPLGQLVANVIRAGVEFRKKAAELDRAFARFDDDNAAIATATGIAEGSIQALRDLTARAAGEMCSVTLLAVGQGAATHTKTLLDSLSVG